MAKKIYKWNDSKNEGGKFSIDFDEYGYVSYKIITGSSIPDTALLMLILSDKEIEAKAKDLKRQNPWRKIISEGMSGCVEWAIQSYDKEYDRLTTTWVWHSSMREKANAPFENRWIKDIFDVFYDTDLISQLRDKIVDGSLDPLSAIFELTDVRIEDITERYNSAIAVFLEHCNKPVEGYGYSTTFKPIYDTTIIDDYSNYTPVEENKEKNEEEELIDEDEFYHN